MRYLKLSILVAVASSIFVWPALAEYAIVADWDLQMKVSRYNYVKTEVEAQAIVEQLRNTVSLEDRAPDAYYVQMPVIPIGYRSFAHRARFWIADPVAKTISVDTVAIHAWQSNATNRAITAEADSRVDKVFSPDDPQRAVRVRSELIEGPIKVVLLRRVTALRTAAQTLKDSLAAMTAEEILAVQVHDNNHWPE